MSATVLSTSEVRAKIAAILTRLQKTKKPVFITRRGKTEAVLLPMERYNAMIGLLEEREDEVDTNLGRGIQEERQDYMAGEGRDIRVPEPLYRRLERTAALTHRSVAHVLASTIAIALPPISDLPEALADELAGMSWLSDEALRAATQPTFTPEQQKRLSELNNLEDECPLTEIEQAERAALLAEYERSVLRRAQAFAVLAQRGYQTPDYTELTPAT
ncbi:MAG TPA: type II toxin-antitoxin system Phd/YefM family antitoxin [Anaerolineae bacterium]|nr:type II toxin-antitoxin system Phd/YefM family antitoxin [Anaerolineae bacterium]